MVRSRREAELFALVDSLYEAAFDPGRWDEALHGAMRLLGAHAGKAGRVDLASGGGRTLGLQGIDPELHERWQTEHGADDLWARAARERLATSPIRTATGRELVPVEALRTRPAFHEMLARCDIADVVSTALHWSDGSVAFFAVYRDPRREPFDARDRDLHDWIGRHARRAFELGALVARERGRSRALLERLPCAAFVCEADGRVLLRNRRGEALLRRADALRVRHGRLRAVVPDDQRALERALATATRSAAGRSLAGGTALRVRRRVGRSSLALHVDPVVPDGSAAEALAEPLGGYAALVLASDPEERAPIPEQALAAAFGLTPAEARMLAALAAGEAPPDYAERNGISRETARFHVKQLLAKTGARRQADLVRMALESVARLTAPPQDLSGED